MRFAFNNHSVSATFSEKLAKATRRLVAHHLAEFGAKLGDLAWHVDFDECFRVEFGRKDNRK